MHNLCTSSIPANLFLKFINRSFLLYFSLLQLNLLQNSGVSSPVFFFIYLSAKIDLLRST